MSENPSTYKPHGKGKEILDRGMEHIKSVPYKVSLRWLFYRLLQDGYFHDKGKDYKGIFTPLCSKARKGFYGEWRPDILADDTRDRIERTGFFQDDDDIKSRLADYVTDSLEITFDHFYEMDEFIIIAFEARAMVNQFMYYTSGIDLLPFGGDASIPFKWEIAKHLEDCNKWYGGIPLRILYFGDCDNKGGKIFEAAQKDISRWCKHTVQFDWCGLTKEQVDRFNIPENPEKPGEYQWEALTDSQAEKIILEAMANFDVDLDLITAKVEQGKMATKEWREKIRKVITPLVKVGS